MSDLIGLSIKAGLEQGAAYFDVFIGAVTTGLINWDMGSFIGAALTKAFNGLALGINEMFVTLTATLMPTFTLLGRLLNGGAEGENVGGADEKTREFVAHVIEAIDGVRQDLLGVDDQLGKMLLDSGVKVAGNMAKAMGALGDVARTPAMIELQKMLAALNGRIVRPGEAALGGPDKLLGGLGQSKGGSVTPNVSNLEKLNILNLGNNRAADQQKAIANNTRETTTLLKEINKTLLKGRPDLIPSFDNIA